MITIKKIFITTVRLFLTYSFTVACFYSMSWAGNKDIVEKRVLELDELNKRIIKQVPGVPKYGSLTLKARVLHKEWTVDFNIYQQETETKTTGSEIISFSDGQHRPSTVKSGTISFSDDQDTTSTVKTESIKFGENQQEN